MGDLKDTRVALWTRRSDQIPEIEESLRGLGCRVQRVHTLQKLLDAVGTSSVDLVVAFLDGSFRRPLELLSWSSCRTGAVQFPPVVLVAPGIDVDQCLEAMQRGALGCLCQPVDPKELSHVVARGVESWTRKGQWTVGCTGKKSCETR